MYDENFLQSSNSTRYVVSCDVDIAPSIGFRMVNYSRITSATADEGSLSTDEQTFVVQGSDQACTPMSTSGPLQVSDFITNSMLATGAAASWQILFENAYRDGWWNKLHNAVNQLNDSEETANHLNFKNSHNALEDALGLASGIALGSFWGAVDETSYYNLEVTASIQGLRVGPGKAGALVYIVPQLYTIGLLLYLAYGFNPGLPQLRYEKEQHENRKGVA